jgi:hypothetical protein
MPRDSRRLTLTLPSELVRRAKALAAARDTSISALVAEFLEQLTREDDYDDVWQRAQALMAQGLPMRVGEVTWTRDDVHDR